MERKFQTPIIHEAIAAEWSSQQGDNMFKDVIVADLASARHPKSTDRNRISSALQRIAKQLTVGALALATLVPMAGCSGFRNSAFREAVMISYRDMVWARRAYNLRYGNCDRPYADHFENGFCAGYSDVSNGGDGYVPAMPPTAYRSYEYQSADGVQCVNAWFEGYPAGVEAARKENVGNYNNILISKMIDSAVTQERNQKNALPSSVPVVDSADKTEVSPFNESPVPLPAAATVTPVAPMLPSLPSIASIMKAEREAASSTPGETFRVRTVSPAIAPTDATSNIDYMPSDPVGEHYRVPPIVTGSGVDPQASQQPLPISMRRSAVESNRRSR